MRPSNRATASEPVRFKRAMVTCGLNYGFYFPISFGVRRESFYRDNRACMKRCDGKARLFYYPSSGGSIEKMIDLSGRSYRTLPNAFRYRKSLVSGCACRAAPWSAEAKARHLDYAAADAERATGAPQTKKRDVDPPWRSMKNASLVDRRNPTGSARHASAAGRAAELGTAVGHRGAAQYD